jgi:hypothetical protein
LTSSSLKVQGKQWKKYAGVKAAGALVVKAACREASFLETKEVN